MLSLLFVFVLLVLSPVFVAARPLALAAAETGDRTPAPAPELSSTGANSTIELVSGEGELQPEPEPEGFLDLLIKFKYSVEAAYAVLVGLILAFGSQWFQYRFQLRKKALEEAKQRREDKERWELVEHIYG